MMTTDIDIPKYTARTPAQPRNLMPLSTAISNQLPRELRDLVYDFILDEETIQIVHDGAFPLGPPGTERITLPYSIEKSYWPAFLFPRSVHETFRIELVERFLELNRGFTVRSGQNLYALLEKNLFSTGFRYADIALSKLVLDTSFYASSGPVWSPDVLMATLAPILYGNQALSNDFTLLINVHTECCTPCRPSNHQYIDYMMPFFKWASDLRYKYPTLHKIRETVEKTGTKRKVEIWIKMPRRPYEDGPWLKFPLQEGMVGWGGYLWWVKVKELLKDLHGIE